MTDLAKILASIEDSDPSAGIRPVRAGRPYEEAVRYEIRNRLIMLALVTAQGSGLRTGIAFDPKEPDYPVVYIDLPTGQVSWHVTAYQGKWDGHTTTEKYDRIRAFREGS